MLERRILIHVSALVVFLASAALWNAFVRRPSRSADAASPVGAADSVTTTSGAPALPHGAPATPAAPSPVLHHRLLSRGRTREVRATSSCSRAPRSAAASAPARASRT